MRQETFTILFLMRKGRPKKNGLASVYARVTTGSLRQEFYFHCEGKPELWNQKKERMMGTSRLAQKVNEMLDEFRVQILDIRSKLLAEGYAANAAQIKQRYLNPTCNTMMLIAGLTDYVKRRQAEVGVRITQRTADKYERLLRYLKQYLAQRGKAEDIPVERMNYEFLDGFNLFLQTAHRCRHNGGRSPSWTVCATLSSTACATSGLRKTRSATTNSKRTRCRPKSTLRRMNWNC